MSFPSGQHHTPVNRDRLPVDPARPGAAKHRRHVRHLGGLDHPLLRRHGLESIIARPARRHIAPVSGDTRGDGAGLIHAIVEARTL